MIKKVDCVKERILSILPRFDLYSANKYLGLVRKEFNFFQIIILLIFASGILMVIILGGIMKKTIGYNMIARISKELFHMSDLYVIDVKYPSDILNALMLVLAIDAEKCLKN